MRDRARIEIENSVDVYVNCPIEVCIQRVEKGLYKRVLKGENEHFTGISDPYEVPRSPDVVVHTDKESPGQGLNRILTHLRNL